MSAMPFVHSTINRRALLAGGASCAAAALAGAAPSPSEAVKQIELTAADTILMRPKEAVEIALVADNPATGCCIATSRTIRCPE
jgi:hypothetical protein